MADHDYTEGRRRAWIQMLQTCLQALGVHDPETFGAYWILERHEAVARLRDLCGRYGDNDWEDDLHVADVLDKHLGRYLDEGRHGGQEDADHGPVPQSCTSCAVISHRPSMLPMMIPDATHPMGMRSLYFCDKACMADWLDAQDRAAGR